MVKNKNNSVDCSKQELIKKLRKIAKEGRKRAELLGIKEEDIPNLVHKLREIKEVDLRDK